MKKLCGSSVSWVLYIISAVLLVGFSIWFRQAPADAPLWLLRPVAGLAGLFSGIPFRFQEGAGFWGSSRSGIPFVIEKSCSGGNFLVLCFGMLVFAVLRELRSDRARLLGWTGFCLLSYAAAVAASSFRIVLTILLLEANLGFGRVLLHNVVGMITYVTAICACYLLARKALRLRLQGGASPSHPL